MRQDKVTSKIDNGAERVTKENRSKTRVLMLNYEFPPIGGGAATANYHLVKGLSDDGIKIDIVTSSIGECREESLTEDIHLYRLNVNKKDVHYWRSSEILRWTVKAYRKASSLMKRNNYDICHCWFGWPSGLIGYCLKNRVPYLVALRGSDIPGYNPRLALLDRVLFRYASRIVWRNAEEVTVLSRDSAQLARNTLDYNFRIIRNGVDVEAFYPDYSTVENETIKVLFVGRLIERKGVDRLLSAFSSLVGRKSQSRVELSVVGSGNLEQELRNQALRDGLTDHVNFFGRVPHDELPKVYREHDVFVLPSISEAMSNVVPEAMASGLPIITTQTGSGELLSENGKVIEKPTPRRIEKAIQFYFDNPSYILEHGKRSRKLATELSWKRTAEKYAEIYRQIERDAN